MTWLEATLADLEHFSARCIFLGSISVVVSCACSDICVVLDIRVFLHSAE